MSKEEYNVINLSFLINDATFESMVIEFQEVDIYHTVSAHSIRYLFKFKIVSISELESKLWVLRCRSAQSYRLTCTISTDKYFFEPLLKQTHKNTPYAVMCEKKQCSSMATINIASEQSGIKLF